MFIFTRLNIFFIFSHPFTFLLFLSSKEIDEEAHGESNRDHELKGIQARKMMVQQKLEQFHHRQSMSFAKSDWFFDQRVINGCNLAKLIRKINKDFEISSSSIFCSKKPTETFGVKLGLHYLHYIRSKSFWSFTYAPRSEINFGKWLIIYYCHWTKSLEKVSKLEVAHLARVFCG